MYSTELLIQTLISGVMIGVLYALMALGITFIYSIVRMINWAMGEFYMLGSYIQYVVVAYALGRNYWWLAIIAFIAYKGVQLALMPYVVHAVRSRPPMQLLLLRAFGSQERSEELIEEIGMRWRYLGPIHIICAADVCRFMCRSTNGVAISFSPRSSGDSTSSITIARFVKEKTG